MNGVACHRARGTLAMGAIGRLEAGEERALEDHLRGCPRCRRHADELAEVAGALSLVEPTRFDVLGPAGSRPEAGRPGAPRPPSDPRRFDDRRARRPIRRLAVIAAGLVAVAGTVAAGATVASGGRGDGGRVDRTVELYGQPGVAATVELVARAGGTAGTLRERGQAPGRAFTVAVQSTSGRWWVAGSYRTAATSDRAPLQVAFSCAVPVDRVTAVWVRDGGGRTVLRGSPSAYAVP